MERKLHMFLDGAGIRYALIPHGMTMTALETAAAAHVPRKEVAKSVIVKIDGAPAMCVVPATHWVDLDRLQVLTGAENVEMAQERELSELFPECELGAMPAMGNPYGIPTYASFALRDDDEVIFNAGSHTEAVRMSEQDYEKVAHPMIGEISEPRAIATDT